MERTAGFPPGAGPPFLVLGQLHLGGRDRQGGSVFKRFRIRGRQGTWRPRRSRRRL